VPPTNGGGTGVVNVTETNETSTEKPYIYFPTTITQTVLGGVSIGSYFVNPASLLHSNTLALWAPLEFIAIGA
jgi:hypothetical protein